MTIAPNASSCERCKPFTGIWVRHSNAFLNKPSNFAPFQLKRGPSPEEICMRAFHVTSTAPLRTYYGRPGHRAFQLEDFEILTTILSALEWRRHNGPIKLYTDNIGADYYSQINLSTLWDAGIETETLENCDLKTSPNVFWAFARTVALGSESCPCVLLDTDLIVWRSITALIRTPFMAIHSEPLAFEVYVEKERLHTPPGYVWDDWDWTATPLNAALLYFGRNDLREYCVTKGLEFMRNNVLEEEQQFPLLTL